MNTKAQGPKVPRDIDPEATRPKAQAPSREVLQILQAVQQIASRSGGGGAPQLGRIGLREKASRVQIEMADGEVREFAESTMTVEMICLSPSITLALVEEQSGQKRHITVNVNQIRGIVVTPTRIIEPGA